MGLKRITTKEGLVYFVDDKTGKRIITGLEVGDVEKPGEAEFAKKYVDKSSELYKARIFARKLWTALSLLSFVLAWIYYSYNLRNNIGIPDFLGISYSYLFIQSIIALIHRLITKRPSTLGMFVFYFLFAILGFIAQLSMEIQEQNYLKEKEKKQEINYLEKGLIHYNIKEYSLARDCFWEILKQKPADKKILNLLGLTYTYLGKYDSALYVFDSLIKEDDSNWYFYFNRGNAHYFKRNLDLAYEDFHQATALNPDYALAYNN